MDIQPNLNIQNSVFSEQVRILHKNILVSIPANFVCAFVVFIAYYHAEKSDEILNWFLMVILISLLRFAEYYFYYNHSQKTHLYLKLFIVGAALSATLWGLLASVLMPPHDPYKQMIIIVITAGVTAGGIQTLTASIASCFIFVSLVILPLCAWTFMQNEFMYSLIGIAFTTYFFFMITTSIRGYKLLVNTLTLRYENSELLNKLTISNAKLLESYNRLVDHEQQLILINKLNDMLQSCHDSNEAYSVIKLIAQNLFNHSNGSLFILTPNSSTLIMAAHWGNNKMLKSEFTVTDCWALRKGHEYLVNDKQNEILCNHFESPPNSYICMTLHTQNLILGLLTLSSEKLNYFTHDKIQMINHFCEVIQLSLTNIQLRESLYDQSIHDPLTGLFNRRYLDEVLSQTLKQATREKRSLCVAMFDVDNFKYFNDTNGHAAGDEILRNVGSLLKEHFRESDIACRFGGEEFCIVLLNTNISLAYNRLQVIRETIKNMKITLNEISLPTITVSIGIAEAPQNGTTVIEIINAADEALYLAKKNGKDKIECYQKTIIYA